MSGHTLAVTPPHPDESYTLQGVATLDPTRRQARVLFGGKSGDATIALAHVPAAFGANVRVRARMISWTGQLGDATPPDVIADRVLPVRDGGVALTFGQDGLPALREEAAYELVVTPGDGARIPAVTIPWSQDYEAEKATRRGTGLTVRGPEGSPKNVDRFHTSGGYSVEGFKTGADAALDFAIDVPRAGRYDLRVLASTFNKDPLAEAQGPTNVFLRIDGKPAGETELFLPLGYKPSVLDHVDTVVSLPQGRHTLTLATRSLDGTPGSAWVAKRRGREDDQAEKRHATGASLPDRLHALGASLPVRHVLFRTGGRGGRVAGMGGRDHRDRQRPQDIGNPPYGCGPDILWHDRRACRADLCPGRARP